MQATIFAATTAKKIISKKVTRKNGVRKTIDTNTHDKQYRQQG